PRYKQDCGIVVWGLYLPNRSGDHSPLILPLSRRPMSNYNINKGIGRTVEFKGLKAQYLFIFAGGLLGVLVLVMIMYMAGVNSYICLFIGEGRAALIGRQTFALNGKYGERGLMKVGANKRHSKYSMCRKAVPRYLKFNTKSHAL